MIPFTSSDFNAGKCVFVKTFETKICVPLNEPMRRGASTRMWSIVKTAHNAQNYKDIPHVAKVQQGTYTAGIKHWN